MYNRYIPQRDGTYQRKRATEREPMPSKPPQQHPPPPPSPPPNQANPNHHLPVGGFLRNLLPREFDTGDLIIVLLLLLIAGDNPESRSNALLTLALYFIL